MRIRLVFLIPIIWIIVGFILEQCQGGNPDGAGYVEPRVILRIGEGHIRSDIIAQEFEKKAEPLELGIGFKALAPMSENASFVITGEYIYSQTRWEGYDEEKIRKFGISIGVRYYLGR